MSEQSLNLHVPKRAKWRHSSTGNSFSDKLCQGCVRELLNFASPCYIGCAFPATAVKTVAATAIGRKKTCAFLRIGVGRGFLLAVCRNVNRTRGQNRKTTKCPRLRPVVGFDHARARNRLRSAPRRQ